MKHASLRHIVAQRENCDRVSFDWESLPLTDWEGSPSPPLRLPTASKEGVAHRGSLPGGGDLPERVRAKELQSLKKSRMVSSLCRKKTSSWTRRCDGLASSSPRDPRASHITSTFCQAGGTSRELSWRGGGHHQGSTRSRLQELSHRAFGHP